MPEMSQNPYESPQTEANTVAPLSDRTMTETMVFYLRGAAPWLRFVGIAGFIGLGAMVIMILTVLIAFRSLEGMEGVPLGPLMMLTPVLGVLYLPPLVIVFFLTFFTFQFGRKIRSYLQTGENADLEEAFKNNKSLWTLQGVVCIIGLVFAALVLLVTLVSALT
jgi:hypothetical protein